MTNREYLNTLSDEEFASVKDGYGCKHPEDSWTNYWCGDCGEYCTKCGCRGPRAKK